MLRARVLRAAAVLAAASSLVALGALAALARAAAPEDAPPECRAQVDVALRALEPALAGTSRRLAAGAPGTLEHAIASFAPAKFHAVDEGTLPPARPDTHCPPDMASIGGRFCVDRYEGSLVERREGSAAVAWSPFTPPAEGHALVAQSVAGVTPQAYISAAQAARACSAAHKRLCTPVEWRAACGGSQGYAYPYGPTRVARRCHDAGVAPMIVLHAAELKAGWGPAALNDPRLNQLDGTVAKTGAYPECVSDAGVYDMVGNLHEWTADTNGTFQGGYWLDTDQHGEACAYRTIAHEYTYHDYSTGFRCCAAPSASAY